MLMKSNSAGLKKIKPKRNGSDIKTFMFENRRKKRRFIYIQFIFPDMLVGMKRMKSYFNEHARFVWFLVQGTFWILMSGTQCASSMSCSDAVDGLFSVGWTVGWAFELVVLHLSMYSCTVKIILIPLLSHKGSAAFSVLLNRCTVLLLCFMKKYCWDRTLVLHP